MAAAVTAMNVIEVVLQLLGEPGVLGGWGGGMADAVAADPLNETVFSYQFGEPAWGQPAMGRVELAEEFLSLFHLDSFGGYRSGRSWPWAGEEGRSC